MNKYGEMLEDGTLKFVRVLPGPIDRIWAWITDGEKRAEWLAGGGDITHAGQTVRFDFQHDRLTPHDETYPDKYKEMAAGVSYDVEVRVCEAPYRLVLFWPSEKWRASDIEFRLSEEGKDVKLQLFQRGDVKAEELIGSSAGWHVHLGIMAAKLSGEAPAPFWSAHEAFCREYAERFKDELAKLD